MEVGAEEPFQYTNVIVLEPGSRHCRVGLAGGDVKPLHVFTNALYRKRSSSDDWKCCRESGEQIYDDQNDVLFPVRRGVIVDWEGIERIWRSTFYDAMKINLSEQPLLVTEPNLNPKANRERITQIMYESFNVEKLFVANSSYLTLLATGRTTGVAVVLGYEYVTVCPFFEDFLCPWAAISLELGGEHVTKCLMTRVEERGYTVDMDSRKEHGRFNDIKEKHCFVSQDFDLDLKNSRENLVYDTCVDEDMTIGEERFIAPEIFFNPSIYSKEFEGKKGILEMIIDSITKIDVDKRRDLYHNIIISGGSTLFPGFKDRLYLGLKYTVSDAMSHYVKTIFYEEMCNHSQAWTGGALIGSLSTFQSFWLTREEYEEHGPSIVHKQRWM